MARFNDTQHFVKETSIANKELVSKDKVFVGFDFYSETDATLIYFGNEHKVHGGMPFSIRAEEGFMIRSLKIKENGIVFTLYAPYISGV